MVQMDNSNWGETENNRRLANDDTFFYTNASFQHENFNRDEWLALEKYFGGFEEDLTNKLCVFTGPIHLEYDRFYTRNWHDSVRIPSGFFKIICYQDKDSQQLATKAFILFQDDDMKKDRKGGSKLKFTNYQVTISEIEELTGL